MATVSSSHMTAEAFFALPDAGVRYELVAGRLEEVGAASPRSSAVAANVLIDLGSFVRRARLGVVGGADWGARLFADPDTVRAGDVCFVRSERLPEGRVPVRFQEGAPDLIVEVLSPSDRFRAVSRKVREFLAAGALLVWVLDPEERSAVVFRADGSVSEFGEDDVLDGEDVVPGYQLALASIWVDGYES